MTTAGCADKHFETAQALSGEASLTGCLTYDTKAGQYVLTDRNGEKTFVVSEGPDLDLHGAGNHTVRVVGIRDIFNHSKALKAIEIEHLAEYCQVPF